MTGETLEVLLKSDGFWLSVDNGDGMHGLYKLDAAKSKTDTDGQLLIKDRVLESVARDCRDGESDD